MVRPEFLIKQVRSSNIPQHTNLNEQKNIFKNKGGRLKKILLSNEFFESDRTNTVKHNTQRLFDGLQRAVFMS